jgi:hypothetical protein
VPIEVNTDEAPALIRIRCAGPLPTPEEQRRLRDDLATQGLLTENSVSLLDFREAEVPLDPSTFLQVIAEAVRFGMPRKRACLINPGRHLPFLQQFQTAVPWMSTAAFIDEREALEWLLNPEGSAGFDR